MGLVETLEETLRRAIKARDARTAEVVRMLKTKVLERRTARGFAGVVDDDLVRDVIGAYRRQLQKALAEYERLGEAGAGRAEALRFEIGFCAGLLPATLDEATVREAVRERAAALGLRDARQAGRLVGEVMKTHRGRVDAALVRRIAEEILAGSAGEAGPGATPLPREPRPG